MLPDFKNRSTIDFSSGVSTDTKIGTFTVDEDCTGTMVLDVLNQAGAVVRHSVWSIVLTDNATAMQGIMLSMQIPGTPVVLNPVLTFTARRVFTGDRGHGPRR